MAFLIGVPPHAPARLKQYLLAAIQTYHLGNKSIDHVLKRYNPGRAFKDGEPSEQAVITQLCCDVKRETREALRRLHIFYKPAHSGTTSSWAALLRLQATIRAAVFTIRHGFHFETACLLRLFLEQLAWVATVRTYDDIDAIFAVEPSQTVSNLKRLFPGAGFAYGYLSERAHLTPEQTKRYIRAGDEGLSASMNVSEYIPLDAYMFAVLADWYIVLADLTLAQHTDPKSPTVTLEEGEWVPAPDRPFVRKLHGLRHLLHVKPTPEEGAV